MTIREFVLSQKACGINEWLLLIENNKLQNFESIILSCADYYGLIVINHTANFVDAIQI